MHWVPKVTDQYLFGCEHHPYRMHTRDNPTVFDIQEDTLTYGGMLKQQFDCDNWIKIEEQRLLWQRHNQKQLKAESYSGLADAVKANEHRQAGKYVVLSSTFQGSPRHNFKSYQNAMAMVRKYGKPDLFLTFTCNPKWREIVENLRPGDNIQYRNDIIARTFRMKLNALLQDINVNNILGVPIGHTMVVEFQKRGLPHAHILIILKQGEKPLTDDDYDRFVCAEIPNPNTHPILFSYVTKHMLHGPCGVANPSCVCMDKDTMTCTKFFPKQKQHFTTHEEDAFPSYRRRCSHTYAKKNSKGEVIFNFDDTWVVPYNPYLLYKYNAHINLEICNSVSSVKYLYKYVYKGHDKASIALVQLHTNAETDTEQQPLVIDEIQRYIDSRYVGASEACWRIMSFPMADKYPPVFNLQLHEKNGQQLIYEEGEELEALVRAHTSHTTLTSYFETVAKEITNPLPQQQLGTDSVTGQVYPSAPDLTYLEFPTFYTWNYKEKKWSRRKTPKKSDCIGHIYSAHPSSGERFYLRILLCKISGASSFESLRTVNGVQHSTFKAACLALGLLDDDSEWKDCLAEGAVHLTPKQLRQLFATILQHNQPSNPLELWELQLEDGSFIKHLMSEDFRVCRSRQQHDMRYLSTQECDIQMCLHALQGEITSLSNGNSTLLTFGLPVPTTPHEHLLAEGFDGTKHRLEGCLFIIQRRSVGSLQ